jgi:hypothetical protein
MRKVWDVRSIVPAESSARKLMDSIECFKMHCVGLGAGLWRFEFNARLEQIVKMFQSTGERTLQKDMTHIR